MARRRTKRKATAWNRTFGAVAKSCFKTTQNMTQYGACMKSELKSKRTKGSKANKRR